MEKPLPKESAFVSYLVIAFLVIAILVRGLWTFYIVGDLGPRNWDYRIVPDLPGESPYAIYEPLPHPQHIRGRKGE
jgi:hypothetical protein